MVSLPILGGAAAAAVVALPLMVILAVAGSGTPAAASTLCTLNPASAAASPGNGIPSATGTATPATAVTTATTTLSGAQVADARTIISAAKSLGLPDADAHRAAVIAIMTAEQESTLSNEANPNVPASLTLPHEGVSDGTNLDSLGLFQQRPSVGTWGTPTQIMVPAHAAAAFYGGLLAVPGWQAMPAWQAAQTVQVSTDGPAYAQWSSLATGIVGAVYDGTGSGVVCTPVATGNGTDLPPGTPATGLAAAVLAFATAQEGKPYSWGATGPGAYDCSGLVLASFQTIGIDLSGTRTSEAMYAALPHIPDSELQPGDLVFFNPGEDGIPGPGHVGIYTGNGLMINATHPGDVVRVSAVAGFGPYVGAARVLPAAATPAATAAATSTTAPSTAASSTPTPPTTEAP